MNAPNSSLCEQYSDSCDYYGTYDESKSKTFSYVNSDFNISYADESSADGVYATDILHLGDTKLENFQFGIGYDSSSESESSQ